MMCGQICFESLYEQLPLSDDFSIVPSDYYKANGGVVFPNPNAPTGKPHALDEIGGYNRAQSGCNCRGR